MVADTQGDEKEKGRPSLRKTHNLSPRKSDGEGGLLAYLLLGVRQLAPELPKHLALQGGGREGKARGVMA